MVVSKWPVFYGEIPVWKRTCERRPVCPSWWVGGVAHKFCCAKIGGGVYSNGWVCAGLRKLFWREKFIALIPMPNPTPILAPGSVRDLEPELRGEYRSTACDCNWYPYFNPTLNVQNWFFHFFGHEWNQSSEYDLGLLSKNPINLEDDWRKTISLLV